MWTTWPWWWPLTANPASYFLQRPFKRICNVLHNQKQKTRIYLAHLFLQPKGACNVSFRHTALRRLLSLFAHSYKSLIPLYLPLHSWKDQQTDTSSSPSCHTASASLIQSLHIQLFVLFMHITAQNCHLLHLSLWSNHVSVYHWWKAAQATWQQGEGTSGLSLCDWNKLKKTDSGRKRQANKENDSLFQKVHSVTEEMKTAVFSFKSPKP